MVGVQELYMCMSDTGCVGLHGTHTSAMQWHVSRADTNCAMASPWFVIEVKAEDVVTIEVALPASCTICGLLDDTTTYDVRLEQFDVRTASRLVPGVGNLCNRITPDMLLYKPNQEDHAMHVIPGKCQICLTVSRTVSRLEHDMLVAFISDERMSLNYYKNRYVKYITQMLQHDPDTYLKVDRNICWNSKCHTIPPQRS